MSSGASGTGAFSNASRFTCSERLGFVAYRRVCEYGSQMIVVAQRGGTVKRFQSEAYKEAFMIRMGRLGAGEDAPPEYPLMEAARNSSDLEWSASFFGSDDPEEWIKPVPDLSGS